EVSGRSDGTNAATAERAPIGAGYFDALGVPLRSGRPFTAAELANGARVAIVDEPLASRLLPDPTGGGQLWLAGASYAVGGISSGYSRDSLVRRRPRIYLPLAPARGGAQTTMSFLVRAEKAPGPLVETIRRDVQGLGADYRVSSAFTLGQILEAGA